MTAHRTRSAWFYEAEAPAFRGTVCYDADCSLCTAGARRFAPLLATHGFRLEPLQSPGVAARLGLRPGDVPSEMALIDAAGRVFGGAEAVARVCREIGWAWPVWAASRVPGVGAAMRAGYRFVAKHRHCAGGACRMPARRTAWVGWAPLAVLPAGTLALGEVLPPWAWMWAICAALFAGLKWATFWRAPRAGVGASLAYLVLWPGMDAKRFLHGAAPAKPKAGEWAAAAFKTALGAGLFFAAPRLVAHELAVAWIAMAGLVLAVHCGAFHLISCFWRAAGRDAAPLMDSPLLAGSPSDFWGGRWNRAFTELGRDFVVKPLRRAGPAVAGLTVFILSGLVHELVISVPARGGWGLPTAYFLLQGLAVTLEKSRWGRALGLGGGPGGRLFAWAVVAGPAFWLFHPPFVRGVVLPMLRAVGAQ